MLRRNLPANNILLFFTALLFWLPKFLFIPDFLASEHNQAFLISGFFQSSISPLLHTTIAFIIFFITAIMINSINIKLQIVENVYQLPGFLFIVFSGLLLNLQQVTAEMIANILLLTGAFRIFTIYKEKRVYAKLFDSGFLFALMCFLNPDLVLMLPIIIIAILVIRIFSVRELLALILGAGALFFLVFSLLYFFNKTELLEAYFNDNYLVLNHFKYTSLNTIISIPLALLFIFGLVNGVVSKTYKKVVTRKYINIIMLFTVFFGIYYISPYSGAESMIFLFAPLSVLLANLYKTTSKAVGNVLVFGFIISVFIIQAMQIMFIKSII